MKAIPDEEETGLATLQGGATLNPANTRVRADARFSYSAPGTANQKASVNLVARSKRGVGLASVDFDTDTAAFFCLRWRRCLPWGRQYLRFQQTLRHFW